MRFAQPEYWYLLLLLPLLIGLYFYARYKYRQGLLRLGELPLLERLMGGVAPWYCCWGKALCMLLSVLLTVGLLARPQLGMKPVSRERAGVDLMIALDLSRSMLATDEQPNRLENAKFFIARLLQQTHIRRVGLIVFAGNAYTQIPLTSDIMSVRMFLPSLHPDLLPVQGTDTGKAIELGIASLTQTQGIEAGGRSMLVITDGENHDGNAILAAQTAAESGILVNVAGTGSSNGSTIPQANGEMKRDRQGNVVHSRINTDFCTKLAYSGGGIFVLTEHSGKALSRIETELKKLTRGKTENVIYTEYRELFQYPALAVLLLLLAELLLFSCRWREWFQIMKKKLIYFNK